MKKILLLFILALFLIPEISFSKDFDNSVIGMQSTKVRLIYGEPIEKIEYGVLHTYSFLYPTCIIYFKNDIAYKIVSRENNNNKNFNPQQETKVKSKKQKQKQKNYNKDIVNDMFGSNQNKKNEEQ